MSRSPGSPAARAVGPIHVAALAVLAVLATGCGRTLETDYGAVRGPSINGISAFVQLLRAAGHDTTATRRLPAPDADRGDTLVVFADGFGPPEPADVDHLDRFLDAGGPRTLVVALRDGDCAIDYWRSLAARSDLEPAQRDRVEAALAAARAELAARLVTTDGPFGCRVEALERDPDPAATRVELRSAGGFADDAVETRWSLHRRLVPPAGARVLWRAGDDPLLVRVRRGASDFLVVAAATPLLNGGLVDPGNRRLAENLVARLPPGGRVHVAASTAAADAASGDEPSILRLLAVAPHPWIAAQALAAMALFCWWRAPIVGRPRRGDPAVAQNFGHHVAALGSLLMRARGDDYAARRMEEWRRLSRPEAARGRRARRLTIDDPPAGGSHARGR